MKVHHKPPSLVSMWMLDVFCCALGCVTLLWLLNTRHASEQTAAAQSAVQELLRTQTDRESVKQELVATKSDLDSTRQKLESEVRSLTIRLGEVATARRKLEGEVKDLTGQLAAKVKEQETTAGLLAARSKEAEETASQLATAKAEMAKLATALQTSENRLKTTAADLASATARFTELDTKLKAEQADAKGLADRLAAAKADAASLTTKLGEKATAADELATLGRKKDESLAAAQKMIADLVAKSKTLETQLEAANKESLSSRITTSTTKSELALAAGQIKDLEKKLADSLKEAAAAKTATNTDAKAMQKQLADAQALIVELQGDRTKLSDKFEQLRRDTDSRFAGISLTGRRVIFMVDRSGSMDRTAEQAYDPSKWPIVADAVAKVMRSLPQIEQFQVMVFSKQPQWLIGNGEWLPFNAATTPDIVKNALLKTKVEGDTNLYAAFDMAFQLRDRGLDTIYLFSDGLPTSGPGVTDELLRRTPPPTVSEQTDTLARYVRSKLTSSWNRAFTNQPKVRINAIGFFYESPDLGAFLWALARENDGSFVGMSRP